jgi:hypothetical protein
MFVYLVTALKESFGFNLTLVLGYNQYREVDVMIPTVPAARDIVNARWRTIEERCQAEPNFEGLSQESGEYGIGDGKGNDCDPIVAGMETCCSAHSLTNSLKMSPEWTMPPSHGFPLLTGANCFRVGTPKNIQNSRRTGRDD